jgi:putative chitinase
MPRLTEAVLVQALGIPAARAAQWIGPMRAACELAQVSTVPRLASWLAQIGHETGRLRYVREIWGPTAQQARYEPHTTLSARLGNTRPGDGRRYAGHGLIQVTGRANHRAATQRLRARIGERVPDFEAAPLLLCAPEWAALSAADYWLARRLNGPIDAGDLITQTRRVNGGTNGLADRQAIYTAATAALLRQEWAA